jgi:integrase
MRRGEVAAATWSALDGSTISVSRSLQRVGGELRTMHPKTDRSRRTIVLPPVTIAVLRQWRKDQAERRLFIGAAWNDGDYIIDRGDGRPCDPSGCRTRSSGCALR